MSRDRLCLFWAHNGRVFRFLGVTTVAQVSLLVIHVLKKSQSAYSVSAHALVAVPPGQLRLRVLFPGLYAAGRHDNYFY